MDGETVTVSRSALEALFAGFNSGVWIRGTKTEGFAAALRGRDELYRALHGEQADSGSSFSTSLEAAAGELSTYAASIHWSERQTNTADWLAGLLERIEAVQAITKPPAGMAMARPRIELEAPPGDG